VGALASSEATIFDKKALRTNEDLPSLKDEGSNARNNLSNAKAQNLHKRPSETQAAKLIRSKMTKSYPYEASKFDQQVSTQS
jgi:hypothetical protein